MNIKKFFSELKRRNVYKVAITYAITAWLLAQIVALASDTFGAPGWVNKMIFITLIIGFPIALILAWAFEMSPQGIIKTTSIAIEKNPYASGKKKPSKKRIIFITSLGIALLITFSYYFYQSTKDTVKSETTITLIKDKTIAVLPFKNWSGDQNLEYVCDGFTDAIITRLTKIGSIDKVVPFTSMVKYKETVKSLPEIAKELNVNTILEGNFQLSGDHVKINFHLIDGLTANHFWSDEYSRDWKINEIFEIQVEVVENVVKNMNVQVSDIEIESVNKIPTNSKEAYNLFLQANHQLNKFDQIGLANAKLLYEKAIALDSNFVDAYISLAMVWGTRGGVWGGYNEQQAWENQKTLFRKVLEIDSTNIQINNWLRFGSFNFDWDFDVYEKIYRTNSNLDQGFRLPYGYAIKTGRFNEALSNANMEILDYPSAGFYYFHIAEALFYLGKKDEVLELLETLDPLYSDDLNYLRETTKYYYYLGEYEKSRGQLKQLMTHFIDRPPIVMWFNAVYAQKDENKIDVAKYLGQLTESYESDSSGSPAWFIALYYCHIKDYEKAFLWLQKSYERHETEMTWLREEPLLIPLREDVRYKELYRKIGFPKRT